MPPSNDEGPALKATTKSARPVEAIYLPKGMASELDAAASSRSLNFDYDREWALFLLWQVQRAALKIKWDQEFNGLVVNLHSQILKDIRRDYRQYLDLFMDAEILVKVGNHSAGHHASRYRFGERFHAKAAFETHTLTKKTIRNRIQRWRSNPGRGSGPFFEQRRRMLEAFEVDRDAALDWLSTATDDDGLPWVPDRKQAQSYSVIQIAEGRLRLKKNDYGREHSNFSNLGREIRRRFLSCKGEPLVELDIPSSQPYFLLMHMAEHGAAPVREVLRLATHLRGDFYNSMASYFRQRGLDVGDRESAKRKIFKIFYDKVRRKDRSQTLFARRYPKITAYLERLKWSDGHGAVSHLLMRAESEFMFSVSERAQRRGLVPFFTVHDCIVVPTSIASSMDALFVDELHRRGLFWIKTLRKEGGQPLGAVP